MTSRDLAELLRHGRLARNMTHAEAGVIFGVDGYTFMRWEQGQSLERYACFWRGIESLTRKQVKLAPQKCGNAP